VKVVNVVWESSAEEGETALEHGQADLASVPPTDSTSILIPLIRSGAVTETSAPGLSIFFSNFDMEFNQKVAQGLLPSGITLNAPSNLFQDLAFRQFMVHAFPYETVQDQYNTINDITDAELYGGIIPEGMGNYYPTNISWDMTDPSAVGTGSAGYWWSQVEAEKGIAATACTSASPCVFPYPGQTGAPLQDEIDSLWVSEVSQYSDGAVRMVPEDINFANLVENSFAPPGQNGMPVYNLGWAPDYPDPTDYIGPMAMPDSTYTWGNALQEGLAGSLYPASMDFGNYMASCPASYVWQTISVTTACQGTAYENMIALFTQASHDSNLIQRALLYNEGEHIDQQLALMTPNPGQGVGGWGTASWISGASMNENPCIGGGGDSTWFTVTYV
jgi:hypothetical protein